MNKRTNHGMIFIPLLFLLIALFLFALGIRDNAPSSTEEGASDTVKLPDVPEVNYSVQIIEKKVYYAPSPPKPAEASPLVEDWVCPLTDEEIELIALLTMAEAEGEPEYGQRLVIDTVLNRMDSDHFPDSVHDVIYQKNQYTSMTNGRTARCRVKDELRELVRSELKGRTNDEVVFFRTKHYHSCGVPLFPVGAHYFSKYG